MSPATWPRRPRDAARVAALVLLLTVPPCRAGTAAPARCLQGSVEVIVAGVPPAALCPPPAPAPAAAARIEPRLQHERDRESREILSQELRREQDTLERLRRSAADPQGVARAQANVLALQREIARLSPATP